MLKTWMIPAMLGAALALGGCGGSDGGSRDPTDESGTPNRYYHRLLHAMPDAPLLSLQAQTSTITSSIDYRRASALTSRSLGASSAEITFTIDSVGPDGAAIPDLLTSTLTVQGNTEYSFIATGQFDAPELVVVPNPRRDRPFDGLFFQFAHVATGAGALDVYVTEPDTDLASTAPVASLSPLGHTGSIEVPFQDKRIRLTAAGTLDVVFDSGTLAFRDDPNSDEDGIEWLIAVADNLLPADSPLKLIASNGTESAEFYEKEQAATLRVAHANTVFPAVDVIVGDAFGAPLATGLSYRQRSASTPVRAGRVSVNLTPPGEPGTFVFEDTITTGGGLEFTLFLVADDGGEQASFVSATEARGVSTDARLRLINLAPDSDYFSLYVAEEATNPPLEDDRRARDIPFEGFTDYFRFVPGRTYQVTLTERAFEAGENPDDAEENVVIGPFALDAPAGSSVTLVILPPEQPGGPETLEIYDDLLP